MFEDLREAKYKAEIAALEAEQAAQAAIARVKTFEADLLEHRVLNERASSDEANIYYFHGPVNALSSSDCIESAGFWARKRPGSEITIVFNSPGGGVFEGLALYDFIKDLRARGHKVVTKSVGMAASMGGILLQAGDERVMGPNAYMLIHEVSSGTMGKVSEMEDALEFSTRLQERLLGILAERSTMTTTQIKRKWKKKDWWLDAPEALELGFIDRIEE